MPISMDALRTAIHPEKTALLLGAGASVPSGAPTGSQLAASLWKQIANSEPQSEDLTETATILELRYSRQPVVAAVIANLKRLQPSGGLLGLPKLPWEKLFTTNFDRLVEIAYQKCGVPLTAIRSNYDFTNKESSQGTRLFKIHGCISQDDSLGDKASMILTETDYETHTKYRQLLYAQFNASLLDGDVLIIGQSLKDRHLNDMIREVLKAKQDQGAPGQVYVLVYDADDLRAPVLENRGARIAFGGIDEFIHAMSSTVDPKKDGEAFAVEGVLPINVVSTVVDVVAESKASPNVIRMFNGGAAIYADILAGATFERLLEVDAVERLVNGTHLATIIGAAGVGKTTFARRIASKLVQRGLLAWEHKSDFPFQHKPWIGVEAQLRAAGKYGVLVLDECTHYLRQTNALIDHLAGGLESNLKLILTANSAQWTPRLKSPNIFAKGLVIEPSRLSDSEINSLINLVQYNNEIASLVHSNFKKLSRSEQFQALRQKCGADMFVCLKNIFANESLDIILLREFDELDQAYQEYYRYVAALESVGTRVHRHLIIRMLRMPPAQVSAVLNGLSGIVDEYDIAPKVGIYGWRTRHIVIARKIADYKFSSLLEMAQLFEAIIENINPSLPIEVQTVREICDTEFGIGRLADSAVRQKLYRRLIEIAPAERIPWHRLIRELLNGGQLEDTEYVIRNAEAAAGADAPIDRFKVRLLVVRSQKTVGISESDRLALLRKAYEVAISNIGRHKGDKYSYYTLCDVAVQLVQKGESSYLLEEAIAHARNAAEAILDPEMPKRIREYEDSYLRRK